MQALRLWPDLRTVTAFCAEQDDSPRFPLSVEKQSVVIPPTFFWFSIPLWIRIVFRLLEWLIALALRPPLFSTLCVGFARFPGYITQGGQSAKPVERAA